MLPTSPLLAPELFAHPIDASRKAPSPFPEQPDARNDIGKQCAFDKRAQRIQLETERQQLLLRAARDSGFEIGHAKGWRSGCRFGFGLGLVLGCALIATSVFVGTTRAGVLP